MRFMQTILVQRLFDGYGWFGVTIGDHIATHTFFLTKHRYLILYWKKIEILWQAIGYLVIGLSCFFIKSDDNRSTTLSTHIHTRTHECIRIHRPSPFRLTSQTNTHKCSVNSATAFNVRVLLKVKKKTVPSVCQRYVILSSFFV